MRNFLEDVFYVGLYFAKVLDLIADKYDDCPRGYPVGVSIITFEAPVPSHVENVDGEL